MNFFSGVTCAQCKKEVPGDKVYKIDEKYICNSCYNPKLHKPQVKPLLLELTDAAVYPFKANNLSVLITGSILFIILKQIAFLPLLLLVAGAIPAGYLCGYLMGVIVHSAEEYDDIPELPLFSIDSFLIPLVKTLCVLAISSAPYITYVFIIQRSTLPDVAGVFLFVLAWAYFPMAFASASIAHTIPDTIIKASPQVVFPLIIKSIIDYVIGWGIVSLLALIILFLHKVIAGSEPTTGLIVITLFTFYLLLAGMRVIGIVYRRNKRKVDAEYPGVLYKQPPYQKK